MSRHGDITLPWGDGDYTFRLGLGEMRGLQEVCDAGPLEIASRLRNGTWLVDDVRETIRLGLIGGGMTQDEALKRVKRFVDSRPLMENCEKAIAILIAAVVGAKDEPADIDAGKATGAETTKAGGSQEGNSPSLN
jgi:hypothetical protein